MVNVAGNRSPATCTKNASRSSPARGREGIGIKNVRELTELWATENALVATGGDYRKTARLLKVHEKSIHRHVERMQLTHLLKPGDEPT
jgi:hypothetical protein